MKHLLTLIIPAIILTTACSSHYNNSDATATERKRYALETGREQGWIAGFKKIEYELVKEDLSGKPFKIKLFLYENNRECKKDEVEFRKYASAFIETVHGANAYKLIEVNFLHGSEEETYIYQTVNL